MRKEQGFSLVELLIVVAIICIIAAIAVPSLLTARMAANESSGVEGCRVAGTGHLAYFSVNNQHYTDLAGIVSAHYVDTRFTATNGFNGYTFADVNTVTGLPTGYTTQTPDGFGVEAAQQTGLARYTYALGSDQVVRYEGYIAPAEADPQGLTVGAPIGIR